MKVSSLALASWSPLFLSLLFSLPARAGLTKVEAGQALVAEWEVRKIALRKERAGEIQDRSIRIGDKTLRWQDKSFGEIPKAGHSLWISLHGGGGAPAEVNDQQWHNQARLYEPGEGIYLAPRAPTDHWNLWHESHIDPLFDRLIEDHIALRDVNPDRVYLMGYSAGGDGVWQLAPRMADRWAAVAMMAGHPNEASLLGLRNLPIALFVGGNDAAYNRNKVVAARAAELDRLHAADSTAYIHLARIYAGLPHWMDHKDAEALPWMAGFTRRIWPAKIVWVQDDITHNRFYWLGVPPEEARARRQVNAVAEGQVIRLTGDVPSGISVYLSDELLNLDLPVEILVDGRSIYRGVVERSAMVIREELAARGDPRAAASARIVLRW